jgi:RimJ/RimL family protein N-acetyltransferase
VADALEAPSITGRLVRIEPLSLTHRDALLAAGCEGRGSYDFTWVPRDRREAEEYVRYHLGQREAGGHLSFALLRRPGNRVVGHTALFNFRFMPGVATPFAVEIGHTWLSASAQGTGINLETKSLLCDHAFGTWGVARVDFKTDARNARSRAALASLGAQFEGVLRSFSPSWAPGERGRTHDSAMFSIVASEWPRVKAAIATRLGRASPPARR